MCLNWIIGQPFSPLVDQSVEILTLWTQEVNNKNHEQASNNTLPSLIYKQLGLNHVYVILSHRRDTITSV